MKTAPRSCFVILVLLALTMIVYAQKEPEAGFAIQSGLPGKNIRTYEARRNDGNRIVLYDSENWKCMTWKMEKVDGDVFQLRNLLTKKSFQPDVNPKEGSPLFQQPWKKDAIQQWEFLKQAGGVYRIRLKGTELYISTSSEETNSSIVLDKKRTDKSQDWRLVEQSPQI